MVNLTMTFRIKRQRVCPAICLLGCLVSNTVSALAQTESCDEIRALINAQTGVMQRPDIAMLKRLAPHRECRFTAAEVFRAALGDRPMPQPVSGDSYPRERGDPHQPARHREHRDDD